MRKQYDLRTAINNFPISRWLSSKTNTTDHGGKFLYTDCPICGGRKKLIVRRNSKSCVCYRCQDGGHGAGVWNGSGGLIDLVQLIEKGTREDAVRTILELANWPEKAPEQRQERPHRILPREAIPILHAPENHLSREKLRQRGLTHLEPRIYIAPDGYYADRYILPTWYFGDLTGFEAKTYRNGTPKSLFPSDWFSTFNTIYTTPEWDDTADFVVITESIFDAETFRVNTLGIFGSHLHSGQLLKLMELRKRKIGRLVWCLDEDAWNKQRKAILSKTLAWFDNLVCRLPSGTDPNALGHERCWDLVAAAETVYGEPQLLF